MTRTTWQRAREERGAAVVEFTLVSVVLLGLFLAVLQFAFVLHVRNTVTASAADGARTAAVSGGTLAEGTARTRQLIAAALPDSLVGEVSAGYVDDGGLETVQVQVSTSLPLVGWLGVEHGITASGHAVVEDQW
ncbi:MAG TPA: TadE family protein [Jiangellaceae bacterium]|nr:TadE family protein [Jiangellaceae bacterium]